MKNDKKQKAKQNPAPKTEAKQAAATPEVTAEVPKAAEAPKATEAQTASAPAAPAAEAPKPAPAKCSCCGSMTVDDLPKGRRCFLAQAGTLALAAAAISPAIFGAATTMLTPITSKQGGASGAKRYRVTSLDQLAEDGTPSMFAIKDDRMDGWVKYENISVGAVWVRRTADGVQAFQSVCPHAGCPIMWDDAAHQFYCPCHAATFTVEGVRTEQPSPSPSPRDMDTLEAVVEADGSVMVTFQRFKEGSASKVAEG